MNNLLTKELTAQQEAAIYTRFETKVKPQEPKVKISFVEVIVAISVSLLTFSTVALLAVLLKPLIFALFN